MDETSRIEAPARLIETVRQGNEQIARLSGEVRAVIIGAALTLEVPGEWQWDGAGWVAPEGENEKSAG